MRTYLIVAHRTLVGRPLVEHVASLGSPDEVRLHLVVPVKHPAGPWSDGVVEGAARSRLDEGMAEFAGRGYDVSGEVGDANPVYAVGTVLRRDGADRRLVPAHHPHEQAGVDVEVQIDRQESRVDALYDADFAVVDEEGPDLPFAERLADPGGRAAPHGPGAAGLWGGRPKTGEFSFPQTSCGWCPGARATRIGFALRASGRCRAS